MTRAPDAAETSVPNASFGCSRTEPVFWADVPVESSCTSWPKILSPQEVAGCVLVPPYGGGAGQLKDIARPEVDE